MNLDKPRRSVVGGPYLWSLPYGCQRPAKIRTCDVRWRLLQQLEVMNLMRVNGMSTIRYVIDSRMMRTSALQLNPTAVFVRQSRIPARERTRPADEVGACETTIPQAHQWNKRRTRFVRTAIVLETVAVLKQPRGFHPIEWLEFDDWNAASFACGLVNGIIFSFSIPIFRNKWTQLYTSRPTSLCY